MVPTLTAVGEEAPPMAHASYTSYPSNVASTAGYYGSGLGSAGASGASSMPVDPRDYGGVAAAHLGPPHGGHHAYGGSAVPGTGSASHHWSGTSPPAAAAAGFYSRGGVGAQFLPPSAHGYSSAQHHLGMESSATGVPGSAYGMYTPTQARPPDEQSEANRDHYQNDPR